MILKQQDDRWADIRVLEQLLQDPRCDVRAKGRIDDEIRKLRAGDRGERMAAHVLDIHYGKSANWILMHDLRIVHDGEVAQIDHLLVGRCLDFWILESKNFANGVKINEHGEFVTFYENRPRGVDSPIEQNRRHLRIFQRMIDGGDLPLPTRLGFKLKPNLRSLILISGGAIKRPQHPVSGLDTVIRSDQAATHIEAADAAGNPLDLMRLVGQARLAELGAAILSRHQPLRYDWERRLGFKQADPAPQTAGCRACGAEVSKGVVRFCRQNAASLDGRILCMSCQPGRTPSRRLMQAPPAPSA